MIETENVQEGDVRIDEGKIVYEVAGSSFWKLSVSI